MILQMSLAGGRTCQRACLFLRPETMIHFTALRRALRRGEGSVCDTYLQVKGILAALSGFAMDYLSWAGLEVLLGWPADGTGVGRSAIVFFFSVFGTRKRFGKREREMTDRSRERADRAGYAGFLNKLLPASSGVTHLGCAKGRAGGSPRRCSRPGSSVP